MAGRGRAAGGGRQKGTPNKATAEIREAAQAYTHEALETLAYVMRHGTTESARVAAADKLLDRAYGRPAQALQHMGADDGSLRATATPLDFSGLDQAERDVLRKALEKTISKAAIANVRDRRN